MIALDSTSSNVNTSGTVVSATHVCTGSDLILFAAIKNNQGGTVTSLTYNGVAMTLIGTCVDSSSRAYWLYYLINPASGSHSITFTAGTSGNVGIFGISFTGAKQSGQPDNNNLGANPTVTSTSYSQSISTVADNCFEIMVGKCDDATPITGGTNTSLAADFDGAKTNYNGMFMVYSTAGKTPAGSASLVLNAGITQQYYTVMASFSPSLSSPVVKKNSNLLLLGVG